MSTSASPPLVPPPRIQRHPYFGVLARMAAHGKFRGDTDRPELASCLIVHGLTSTPFQPVEERGF